MPPLAITAVVELRIMMPQMVDTMEVLVRTVLQVVAKMISSVVLPLPLLQIPVLPPALVRRALQQVKTCRKLLQAQLALMLWHAASKAV